MIISPFIPKFKWPIVRRKTAQRIFEQYTIDLEDAYKYALRDIDKMTLDKVIIVQEGYPKVTLLGAFTGDCHDKELQHWEQDLRFRIEFIGSFTKKGNLKYLADKIAKEFIKCVLSKQSI